MEPDFTSVYTAGFPALLQSADLSLVVSTYQAGKLIFVRADGDALNTHFRHFPSPMGLAWNASTGLFGIGIHNQIQIFANHPQVSKKLEPPDRHDLVLLPRQFFHTGDIRVHEIQWVDDELWAVNTRFSCLCKFHRDYNFIPEWKPDFITAIAPEDRCHLNGMAWQNDRIVAVSMLGRTNDPEGWRKNKLSGGCLWDPQKQESLLENLCMPHSPRMHNGSIWFLESGIGALSCFNPKTNQKLEIIRLPGFTRGLAFQGDLAFVGLSQVRESAIFGGVPVASRETPPNCGVWVVDIAKGTILAFLRFEGSVQEIFSIEILSGIRFPELINEPCPVLNSSFVLP